MPCRDSELGRQYPAIIRRWRESWDLVIPFFDFAPDLRPIIYTANMIESIDFPLRTATRNRGHLPSTRRWSKCSTSAAKRCDEPAPGSPPAEPIATGHWHAALNQFDIMVPGRLERA
jgi:putative transposase